MKHIQIFEDFNHEEVNESVSRNKAFKKAMKKFSTNSVGELIVGDAPKAK